ncbi:MAG: hypothetical protein V7K15_10270 [Nostoc sp.]
MYPVEGVYRQLVLTALATAISLARLVIIGYTQSLKWQIVH